MKKRMALTITAIILITVCCTAALADGAWTCPTCGETWPVNYNFCPNDQTSQPSSGGSWPVIRLSGSSTSLKAARDRERRYQSYFGPNRNFPGAGAYKYYKVTGATAFFREGEYVLVDMSYTTVGRRILYFRDTSLTNASVEYVNLVSWPAVTTATIQPLFGPGHMYDIVEQNNKGVYIGQGTRVNVFFETNGWVFAEFSCSLGTIRAWLPADQVR